jgi:hypothetical protein
MSLIKNILSGAGNFLNQATRFSQALSPLNTAVTAISGLFDTKDSGNTNPFMGGGSAIQTTPPAPLISTTTETGAGPFAGGGSSVQSFTGLNNYGSATPIFPRPAPLNQDQIIETSQSSLGALFQQAPNILGIGSQIAKRIPAFQNFFGQQGSLKIPQVGDIVDVDQDQLTFNTPRTPMFEEFTQLLNPMMPQLQQAGAGFMSPVLGRIKLSPRGTLIITRKMRSQFKALADNVGLAQASNIAGVPLEIGAMILTKRFPQRSKSISTKKMRDCARTYKQVMQFANMIPKRTATRTTRAKTMRGASTVIQNS